MKKEKNQRYKAFIIFLTPIVVVIASTLFFYSGYSPDGRTNNGQLVEPPIELSSLEIEGREEGEKNIHIGIDWLTSIAFEHIDSIGKKVIVLGGGNTAMDCCRSSLRLGADDVKVIVRSPFEDMKASEWEIEDAMNEHIPIFENHVPKRFITNENKLAGIEFEKVEAVFDENGKRSLVPTGEDPVIFECDDVLVAIGQDNAFEWIERDCGIEFGEWDMPCLLYTSDAADE